MKVVVHWSPASISNRFRDIRPQNTLMNTQTNEHTNKHCGSQFLLMEVIKVMLYF